MDKKIDELVELDEPFAIVIADIDHFKKINDTYGHIVGDKVLESFASILQKHLKDKAIVSRWGGEEFLIVIPKCNDIDEVYKLIEELREKIERYDFPEVHNVTASFGCTIHYPSNSFKDTMHQADKALYKAKELGRNCVVKF
jgi:polar amino acid transport system substrate-binding protein